MQSGKAGLLVEASDGSADGRARFVGGRGLPVVAPLPAEMLGGVFGRDHAVHVAIAPGRLADAIVAEAARLAGMSEAAPPPRSRGGAGHRMAGRAPRFDEVGRPPGRPDCGPRLEGRARHRAPDGLGQPRLGMFLGMDGNDVRRIGFGSTHE